MVSSIRFFFEGVADALNEKRKHKAWITNVIQQEGRIPGDINFVFLSDDALLEMNKLYLEHDTFTDVISFDLSDPSVKDAPVDGEIYISFDRVKENAKTFGVSTAVELKRVMVHGVFSAR